MRVLLIGGSTANPGGVGAFCERAIELLQHHQVRTDYIPAQTGSLRPSTMGGFLRGLLELAMYRRERPDCVWLQYVNLPDLGYLCLARILNMKVMVTPHLGSNWRSQRNPFLRMLSRILLRLADRLGLISRTQEEEIALPAGVPKSYIKTFLPKLYLQAQLPPASGSSDLRVIHAARLSERKGTFRVIEVSALLRDRGVAFTMSIAGAADSETSAKMRELITHHQLEEHVKVLGRLTGRELFDELRESDVLLHLSDVDSYPLIVLEALSCSVFPLCMELPGARDMIEQYGGHLVQPAMAVEASATFLAATPLSDLRRRAAEGSEGVREAYSLEKCGTAALEALRLTS